MNKKLHIEMLRIIAVVMVVLNHSDLYYTYYTNTDSVLTFFVSLLLSCICRINVPLFMMITGALLIPKAESWSVIFKKRISRMLVVLVAFSALMYGLQCFAWNQDTFSAMAFVEKLLKNEIQTSYWYLYEYIGILMMLPFLGAIARNVDLDCMKYFLGLGLIIKVRMSIVGQFTGYSMIRIESYDPADGLCSLSWRPQIFCNAYEYQRSRDHSMSGQLCIWRILTGAYRSEAVPEAVFAAGRADIRNICMLCLYLLYFAV